ncbi:MAG: hypothetical protein Q9169_008339 [Polycauliona sp. 2 TL-2023]
MPAYRYTPLDPEAKTIRLMRLLPGNFDDEIRILLRTTYLDEEHVPLYEALSYAWGSMERHRYVKTARQGGVRPLLSRLNVLSTVAFGDLPVTPNLDEALRYLRWKDKARDLWIDAICVDQQNLQERGNQVQRMADIYSSARRVVVWLGPTSYRTSLAMETIRSLATQIEMVEPYRITMRPIPGRESHWADMNAKLPYDREIWRSICSLLGSAWFKRLWIRQEIMLAKSAKMQCGHETLDWDHFRVAIFCLYRKAPAGLEKMTEDSVDVLGQARSLTLMGPFEINLSRALELTADCQYTDPRDKIYALLNIIDRNSSLASLKPDYTQTPRSVYQNVVLRCLDQEGSLTLIAWRNRDENEPEQPTWVPDLSKPRNGCSTVWVPPARSCWNSKAEYSHVGKVLLQITGLYCAEILSVEKISFDQMEVPLHYLQLLRRLAMSADLEAPYVDGSLISEAFGRLLCMDRWADGYSNPDFHFPDRGSSLEFVRNVLEASESRLVSLSEMVQSKDSYRWSVKATVTGQSFITTKEGYIGLAPLSARKGDKACMVLGCPYPLILRPNINGHYTMVGSSYVQGLMDGSPLLGPLSPDWRYQVEISDRETNLGFCNQLAGRYFEEDPRLGPLPLPWRFSLKEEEGIFINDETGGTASLMEDPRVTADALRERGVPLQDFILE